MPVSKLSRRLSIVLIFIFFIISSPTRPGLAGEALAATPATDLPPAAPDVHIAASGEDVLLTWTHVTQDTGKEQVTVTKYYVRRAVAPYRELQTAGLPVIAEVPAPPGGVTEVEFRDIRAYAPGNPNYFYRVNAVSSTGSESGGSAETGTFHFPSTDVPPDPAEVAPPLDLTVATDFFSATQFLYSGANPIQAGVAPDIIEPHRSAVLRGRALTRQGTPLPGVTITILAHPEVGSTRTRADGMFDMAVNGGAQVTVCYDREGYLPVQRQVDVPWQDYTWLPDVIMITVDPNVSTIDVNAPASVQVAQGSEVTDVQGGRRETLVFPPGVRATMVLPGGGIETPSLLHVRATEYTVGADGPAAMPAELPSNVGYTYAAEYTIDEAVAAGAAHVYFDPPVITYNENFLQFPTGTGIPMGSYDRERAQWIPTDSGRVVAVIGVTDGLADLDIDGSGTAANTEALTALGITDPERGVLATLYEIGQSVWRVPVDHFTSPWDKNLGVTCLEPCPEPTLPVPIDPYLEQGCITSGSTIQCQNQTLGEFAIVDGTPYRLHYQSDRVPGRKDKYTLRIPVSGAYLSNSLRHLYLSVNIAGESFSEAFSPALNLEHEFIWDGKDAYGRILQGQHTASVWVGYGYPMILGQTERFGTNGNGIPIGVNPSLREIVLGQKWQQKLGTWRAPSQGLGGWTLNVHHAYDPASQTLFLGDGSQRVVTARSAVVNTLVRTQSTGIAAAPDGSAYFTIASRVYRRDREGVVTVIAGTDLPGFSGDGGSATDARLDNPLDVKVASDGAVFIADTRNNRVRRVGTDGIITTVAGNGGTSYSADDSSALESSLYNPIAIALGPDNTLYILHNRELNVGIAYVRRVAPDGLLSTVAGRISPRPYTCSGDDGPATNAEFGQIFDIDVGRDGSLFIATYCDGMRVRRVTPDGIIRTFAGGGTCSGSICGDGELAESAKLGFAGALAIGEDSSLYIVDGGGSARCIRRVSSEGIINRIAGDCASVGYSGDGGLATQALFDSINDISTGPDGKLYVADANNYRIRRLEPPLPGAYAGDSLIPNEDGSEVYHFNGDGRHLRTLHPLTGATLYEFTYDSDGKLVTIGDVAGNLTVIERDAAGRPLALVAPYGQRTALELDAFGYIAGITNAAGQTTRYTYSDTGLMTSLTDRRSSTYHFSYDALGRLIKDENPVGGYTSLSRSEAPREYLVTASTAANRVTVYQVANVTSGAQQRINTFPDGSQTHASIDVNGKQVLTGADGIVITSIPGPDPRFGTSISLPLLTTTSTPGGLVASSSFNRTVTLSSPTNPLSVQSLVDRITLNGRTYTNAYDATSRTFTETSPAGRVRTIVIDTQGKVVREQVTGLEPITYSYDADGRLATIVQGVGTVARATSLTYNDAGYLDTLIDPLNRTLSFGYDLAGRVIQQILPDSRIIAYSYDPNSNVTSITPSGRPAHGFTYSATDLGESYNPPDIGLGPDQTLTSYDLDGQVSQIALPSGQHIDFAYDPITGNLTHLAFSRGTILYGYQAASGQLTTVTAPGGTVHDFGYDGTLLISENWAGPVSGEVARSYNNDLRVSGVNVNDDNITYQYDSDGLLITAGSLTLAQNSQTGLLAGTTLANIVDTWSYTGFGEPSAYNATYSGTGAIYSASFVRDAIGRVTQKTEMQDGVVDVFEYTYDAADHLNSVKKNGVTTSTYTYDSNGNRLTCSNATGTTYASYDDQDRLLTYGSATYAYTGDGRLHSKTVGDETTVYEYDELGNLLSVSLPDGPKIDYLIDGANRRIGKKVDGELEKGFLYYDGAQLIAELDGSGNTVSRFVYGTRDNVPDYMTKGGITYRMITDHLGSPRLIVDVATGNIAQRLAYDEFGAVLLDTNPGFQPFGFAGGIYDPDTGLVRFGARDLDAGVGRWTAKDPILFLLGHSSLYSYVDSDPVNFVDPLGLQGHSNLFNPLSDEYGLFENADYPEGYFTAVGHGNPNAVLLRIKENQLSPQELATHLIDQLGSKPLQPVWLLACFTGSGKYAQRLADRLGQPVIAPKVKYTWDIKYTDDFTRKKAVITGPLRRDEWTIAYPAGWRGGKVRIPLPTR